MKMNINKKYLIIGLISLILVLVIGYSFVHFSKDSVQKNPNSDVKDNKKGSIDVEYPYGKDIKISNSKPGDSYNSEFNVKVTPGNSVKYSISLVVKENTFEKCEETNCIKDAEELVITLIDNDNQVYVKDITNVKKEEEIFLITEEKTPKENMTYNYKIKVEFKNTGSDQTHNYNKTFDAEIKIDY